MVCSKSLSRVRVGWHRYENFIVAHVLYTDRVYCQFNFFTVKRARQPITGTSIPEKPKSRKAPNRRNIVCYAHFNNRHVDSERITNIRGFYTLAGMMMASSSVVRFFRILFVFIFLRNAIISSLSTKVSKSIPIPAIFRS